MKEIGELLRATREAKHLTLDQVQEDTKIQKKYLRALEEGDDSVSPGDVYFRGFLKTYGNYLGLNGMELVQRYKALKNKTGNGAPATSVGEAEPGKPQTYAVVRTEYSRRARHKTRGRIRGYVYLVVFVCVLALALFGIFGLIKRYHGPASDGRTASGADVSTPAPVEPPAGSVGHSGTSPESVVPTTEKSASPVPELPQIERTETPGSISLKVKAPTLSVKVSVSGGPGDECWARVKCDGNLVYEGTLRPGETRTWNADSSISMRLGKPWTVKLEVNGASVGSLGVVGPPKDLTIQTIKN